MSQFTAIDLFSGAGGFTISAISSGISVVAAVEIDKHSCETYRKNFITSKPISPRLYEQDFLSLNWPAVLKELHLKPGECDIVMGGPPCQGFSTHRIKDAGVGDPRNQLVLRYFDAVKAILPKVFIIENVSGLLWPRHHAYLKSLISLARKSGYTIYGPTLLNARDYGVPQSRKRVLIVGVRKNLRVELQWPPMATHYSPASSEALKRKARQWKTAKSVFASPIDRADPNSIHMNHTPRMIAVFKKTPQDGGSRHEAGRTLPCHENHDGHKDVYGRIRLNQPGPTMTTACVNPSKGRFLHPFENHGISLRHAARFQSFPDDFIFCGGLIAAGKQIGNAVPPLLGKAILTQVLTDVLLANVADVDRADAIEATSSVSA